MRIAVSLLLLFGCASSPMRYAIQSNQAVLPSQEVLTLRLYFTNWPLTNCYLESSTDMVAWKKEEFSFTTNTDGSEQWDVHFNGNLPAQYFRGVGQPILNHQ